MRLNPFLYAGLNITLVYLSKPSNLKCMYVARQLVDTES
jgi:hypothetical protein